MEFSEKKLNYKTNKCNYFKSHSFDIAKKQQGKKTSQRMKKNANYYLKRC